MPVGLRAAKQLALAQNIVAVMAASKTAYEQGEALEGTRATLTKTCGGTTAKALQASVAKLAGTSDDATIGLSGSNYAVPPVKGTPSFSRTNGQASALRNLVNYLHRLRRSTRPINNCATTSTTAPRRGVRCSPKPQNWTRNSSAAGAVMPPVATLACAASGSTDH